MYNSFTGLSTLGDGETIKFILEATSVDGRSIPQWNIEHIEVQIVREGNGKMVILDAKASPADEGMIPGPMDIIGGVEECGSFCEFLNKVTTWGKKTEEKMSKWGKKVGAKVRPCGKKTHGEVDAKENGEKKEKEKEKENGHDNEVITIMPIPDRTPSNPSTWHRPPHSRPHNHPGWREGHHNARPWSHHHHHHIPHHMAHNHSTTSAVYKVFIQVLVPIVIGIMAGMLVSLMGMVIGHFAVLAYQKAVGAIRRKRCAPVVEAGDEEVAKGLLSREEYVDEEGEAPPVYDAQTAQQVLDEKQ